MEKDRNQTNYNKLVGRIDDNFYFCDYIFDDTMHDKPFRGATATVLRPIGKDEYNERTDPENLKESLEEHWRISASERDGTTLGLDEWVEYVIETDGPEHAAGFDPSGEHFWDQLRALGFPEDEYPFIECVGGGRSFSGDQEFDEVYDADLLAKIREVERSPQWCERSKTSG